MGGRDQSERLVAINRNSWSRSPGARMLLDTGRSAEALTLAQAALATHETALWPNCPWTKHSARVTADALATLGRTDEAVALRAHFGIVTDGQRSM
jgi:hypothetical protein